MHHAPCAMRALKIFPPCSTLHASSKKLYTFINVYISKTPLIQYFKKKAKLLSKENKKKQIMLFKINGFESFPLKTFDITKNNQRRKYE
jgi:hypothetical protein